MQTEVDERSLLRLFESVLPMGRWKTLQGRAKAQIYSLRVVVWMMLLQRLDERGTQQRAALNCPGPFRAAAAGQQACAGGQDFAKHRSLCARLRAVVVGDDRAGVR